VTTLELYRSAYDKLTHDYQRHQTDDPENSLILTRIFVMTLRYDCLSRTKSAYQAALPTQLMRYLSEQLGAAHECYASPLNHTLPSYCSMFPGPDCHFGSVGNFYSWRDPAEGVYECNPPFDNASVAMCFNKIHALLCGHRAGPLAFLVVIPKMDFDGDGARADVGKELDLAARKLWKPFLRRRFEVQKDEHVYRMGLQHRRQEDGAHWRPTKVSQIFWFANDAGAAKYVITDDMQREMVARFDY
jgi:hypothetical protein